MKDKFVPYMFSMDPRFVRKTKHKMLTKYEEEEILKFSENELQKILNPNEWTYYLKHKHLYNIEETQTEWEKLKEKKIYFTYLKEDEYPNRLKRIPDPPLGLFCKGGMSVAKKSIAIIGARTATSYGKEMSRYFARELAKEGISIISGLAYGIDVAAHEGALEAGGDTYGVLGCGVDIVYPRENYYVYDKICKCGGVLSEYRPGTNPKAWHFPERNRIISGLSDGVLVIEAKKKSGSLITVDCALEQGKEVYAIPGRIGDPYSEGTNWLLREGAKIVTEPNHILEELYPLYEKIDKEFAKSEKMLDTKEKLVYDCLSLTPKSVEEIIYETNLSISEGISILFRLELKNYVKQIEHNYYIISL